MKDGTIDEARAALFIDYAQTACANFYGLADDDVFPANAAYIVARVAADAYVSTVQAGGKARGAAGAGIPGGQPAPLRGVRLTEQDETDLRRARGQRGAFSVNLLAGYTGPSLPWWDTNGTDVTVSTS